MSTLPRVVHVVLSLNPGGTERIVIEMVKQQLDSTKAIVCCLDETGRWASELEDRGVPVIKLGRRPGFQPALARELARYSRRFHADVIHCHHYSPFVYGALARLYDWRTKLVYTEHGRLSDAPPSVKRRIANQILGRLPGAFFSVSRNLRGHMLGEGFQSSRVGVIHNGINPGRPATVADRNHGRRSLGLRTDAFVFGTVARLDPVKDLETMLKAFSRCLEQLGDCTLVVVGDGPERGRLGKLALALGVQKHVVFMGHRDDVRTLLPGFDLYLNSSITEGISITLLEAMSAGVPVIASRVGGTPEIIDTTDLGLLFQSRSSVELSDAMLRLGTDPEFRNRLSRDGRRRVCEHFALSSMARRYVDVYRTL